MANYIIINKLYWYDPETPQKCKWNKRYMKEKLFKECKKKITLKKIEELEEYADLKFPQSYKDHLLKFNGGRSCSNRRIYKFMEHGRWTSSDVNFFLAIHNGKHNNLCKDITTFKKVKKRMPIHILPIGIDSTGNLICISCSGHDTGYIYFWSHEDEVDYSIEPDYNYSNLFLIAKTLDEFFNELKPIEYEYNFKTIS